MGILRSVGVGALVASTMWWLFKKSNKKANNGPVLLESREQKYSIELIKKAQISHDTRIFRFKLPSDSHVLGLAPGKHVNLSAKIEGKLEVILRCLVTRLIKATSILLLKFIFLMFILNFQ